jgi:hypothetical protein
MRVPVVEAENLLLSTNGRARWHAFHAAVSWAWWQGQVVGPGLLGGPQLCPCCSGAGSAHPA